MFQRTKRFPPSGVNTRGGGGLCSTGTGGCICCGNDGVSTTTATGGGDSLFGDGDGDGVGGGEGEREGVGGDGAVWSSSFLLGGDGEASTRAGIELLSGGPPIRISGTCLDSFLSSLGHSLQSN